MKTIYVGTRKGLFTATKQPSGWELSEPAFLGDPVSMVLQGSEATFAALNLGHFGVKLWRCSPGGEWEECAAPAFPESAGDASVSQIWELAEVSGTLWAGTIPGGLFRSDDRGESWVLNENLWNQPQRADWFGGGYDDPGIHSICVDPRDPAHLTVGVSCGGVWVSSDDGESWALRATGMRAAYMPPDKAGDPSIQDPHLIAQCRAAPDTFWCQHHNGIFRSSDGAASWHEIAPTVSGFGFAVASHPDDPDTAWFVPGVKDECRVPVDARLVVTRTRDGGQTFDVLSAGLPPPPAYDLVYRHALALDGDGTTLAMGSTTGSLWISEDQGDSWQCLSNYLPPVYCIRFGQGDA